MQFSPSRCPPSTKSGVGVYEDRGSSWPQVNPVCPLALPHTNYTNSSCLVGFLGCKHGWNRPNGCKLPMKRSLPDVLLTILMELDPPTILPCNVHIVRIIFTFYSSYIYMYADIMENYNMQKYTSSLEALCRQARWYIVNMGQPTTNKEGGQYLEAGQGTAMVNWPQLASTCLNLNLTVESWIAMQWCVHCDGQDLTELQPSTCLNPELRSSNRVQPSRYQPASTCLNLCCWASLVEGWGHTKELYPCTLVQSIGFVYTSSSLTLVIFSFGVRQTHTLKHLPF